MNHTNLDHGIKHLAIIMDGNGRWADNQNLPRIEGHRAGADVASKVIRSAARMHIAYLTLYAFSSENWKRPQNEVENLMLLFLTYLDREMHNIHRNNVRLKVIGNTSTLSKELQRKILDAVVLTSKNTGMTLCIAVSYGGRDEIIHGALQYNIQNSGDYDLKSFRACLYDPDMPDVDLLIRTSGERRISNFLLWHIAYAELYFTDILWPNFDDVALQNAIQDFTKRKRRFGISSSKMNEDLTV